MLEQHNLAYADRYSWMSYVLESHVIDYPNLDTTESKQVHY